MPVNIASIAQSGLIAAGKRVATAATNVANFQSRGKPGAPPSPSEELIGQQAYRPRRIHNISRPGGGVVGVSRPVTPAAHLLFDPSDPLADGRGVVAAPNVDQGRELLETRIAVNAYRANISVLKTLDRMLGKFLETKS